MNVFPNSDVGQLVHLKPVLFQIVNLASYIQIFSMNIVKLNILVKIKLQLVSLHQKNLEKLLVKKNRPKMLKRIYNTNVIYAIFPLLL